MVDSRKELAKYKSGAVWLAMMDLSDYVKWSGISKKYFSKSSNWLLQRLHGYEVNGKPAEFKPEEYARFSDALRDLAKKINDTADAIDKAEIMEE